MLGQVQGQAAPTAADIQHFLPRPQTELPSNMLTLGFLGRLQWFARPVEVSTGVVQISVQTGAKQCLVQVIVMRDVASTRGE